MQSTVKRIRKLTKIGIIATTNEPKPPNADAIKRALREPEAVKLPGV
jgi:hypothetical protein